METYNELSFTAPDIYDQKVTATMGTASEMWDLNGQLPQYFRINVYSASLLNDKLLSPLAPNAKKYYNYRIDTIQGKPHDLQYVIRFIPKSKSFQLVGGYMVVSDNVWSIREIRFSGRSEIFRFSNHVRMGQVGGGGRVPAAVLRLRRDLQDGGQRDRRQLYGGAEVQGHQAAEPLGLPEAGDGKGFVRPVGLVHAAL